MKNKSKVNDEIISLLLKKANGFHYVEEQFEYEKSKLGDGASCKNIKSREILGASTRVQNLSFFDYDDRGNLIFSDDGDKLKVKNETENFQSHELELIKRKVTTHYIPPDMVAIKILMEIFGKEEVSDLSKFSDEELIKMKNKLIEELKNENDN